MLVLMIVIIVIAGCGTKQAPDTKAPSQSTVGFFDVNKVIKAHPKYKQFIALQEQAKTITAEAEAKQAQVMQAQDAHKTQAASDWQKKLQQDALGVDKSFQQDFNKKMSVKQDELNAKLAAKEKAAQSALADELKAYSGQLNKEYESQIFNLQLKLKTVQLTKEETALVQTELDKLQSQRNEKMSVKEQQLVTQMQAKLAPEKTSAERELAAYSKEVNEDLSKQAAAKQAEIAARGKEQPSIAKENIQVTSDAGQRLTMKQQEIQAMQDSMIDDIKNKAGKVAMAQSLDTVLVNISVNVTGTDITDAVIAECNK
jgi:hypothetical protein